MVDLGQKITLGVLRADNGPTRLTVYCPERSHHVVISADLWPIMSDYLTLSPASSARLRPPRCRCAAAVQIGTDGYDALKTGGT